MAHKTVVLDGELSLLVSGQADCELLIPESGESGVFMALREAYPAYTGETVIIPKIAEDQVLQTAMKTVTENITVKEIPVHTVSNPQGGNTVYIGGIFDYG